MARACVRWAPASSKGRREPLGLPWGLSRHVCLKHPTRRSGGSLLSGNAENSGRPCRSGAHRVPPQALKPGDERHPGIQKSRRFLGLSARSRFEPTARASSLWGVQFKELALDELVREPGHGASGGHGHHPGAQPPCKAAQALLAKQVAGHGEGLVPFARVCHGKHLQGKGGGVSECRWRLACNEMIQQWAAGR